MTRPTKAEIEAYRATKRLGNYTPRSELIRDFNPFQLDKLIMVAGLIASVVLWSMSAPTVWWVATIAAIGFWQLEREAKARAGVTQYLEDRIEALESHVSSLTHTLEQRKVIPQYLEPL
jgi:Flp pilus assembly protein TadB